jgi:tRNA wybutosine-synthesizing protein 1
MHFKASKELDGNLRELGAKALIPLQLGNENQIESDFGSLVADFNMWKRRLLKLLLSSEPRFFLVKAIESGKEDKTKNPPVSREPSAGEEEELVESSTDEEDFVSETVESSQSNSNSNNSTNGGVSSTKGNSNNVRRRSDIEISTTGLVDLEDIGTVVKTARKKLSDEKQERANGIVKEMITPELRKALTKQGYKLIGSHSGVKLCRWTKVRFKFNKYKV